MENSKTISAIQNPELLVEENLRQIIAESKRLAEEAALKEERRLGGDWSECGFAWVEVHGIKGNTRLGRMLKKVGIRQGWNRTFQIWNPSGLPVQSVLIKESGADACAKYLISKGFEAHACSRRII